MKPLAVVGTLENKGVEGVLETGKEMMGSKSSKRAELSIESVRSGTPIPHPLHKDPYDRSNRNVWIVR